MSATFTCWHLREQAVSTLECGLGRMSLGDEQLRRVTEVIGASNEPEIVARALACHRFMLLPAFRRLDLYPSGEFPPGPVATIYETLGFAARDGTLFIDVVESYIDVMRQPVFRWQTEMTQLQGEWEPRLRGSMLLAPMAEGGFSGVLRLYLTNAAKIECTRAALAVERYRLARGAKDLGPDVRHHVRNRAVTWHDGQTKTPCER